MNRGVSIAPTAVVKRHAVQRLLRNDHRQGPRVLWPCGSVADRDSRLPRSRCRARQYGCPPSGRGHRDRIRSVDRQRRDRARPVPDRTRRRRRPRVRWVHARTVADETVVAGNPAKVVKADRRPPAASRGPAAHAGLGDRGDRSQATAVIRSPREDRSRHESDEPIGSVGKSRSLWVEDLEAAIDPGRTPGVAVGVGGHIVDESGLEHLQRARAAGIEPNVPSIRGRGDRRQKARDRPSAARRSRSDWNEGRPLGMGQDRMKAARLEVEQRILQESPSRRCMGSRRERTDPAPARRCAARHPLMSTGRCDRYPRRRGGSRAGCFSSARAARSSRRRRSSMGLQREWVVVAECAASQRPSTCRVPRTPRASRTLPSSVAGPSSEPVEDVNVDVDQGGPSARMAALIT